MFLPTSARTHQAVTGSHQIRVRVQVWFGQEQVGEVDGEQIAGGTVTDTWVSGVRRTLSLQVEPSQQWRDWLRIGVELRPFRGVLFGPDDSEMCPMGCFPVRRFESTTRSLLPVRAQDRWQRIAANNTPWPRSAYNDSAVGSIALLIGEAYESQALRVATSNVWTPPGVWDRGPHDTIMDLVEVAAVETFTDRLGVPIIRDRPTVGAPVATIRSGPNGTLAEPPGESIDWENVVNAVGVFSTSTQNLLPPVWVTAGAASPARRTVISGGGPGGWQSASVSSAAFTSQQEMLDAGLARLAKGAQPARQRTLTAIPHPGLDASDTVLAENDDGQLEVAQIQQITTPLTAKDPHQQITLVATGAAA